MSAAGETGGLGYYKGVMLCARPVERNVRPERSSFCATVVGRAELGVDPAHKLKPRRERKRVVTAIVNHRKWLEQLKSEMDSRKQRTVQEMLQEELRRMKIKEKSQHVRELVKHDQASLIKSQVYPLFNPGDVALANQAARSHSERIISRDAGNAASFQAGKHQLRASTSSQPRGEFQERDPMLLLERTEPKVFAAQMQTHVQGDAAQFSSTAKKPSGHTHVHKKASDWLRAAAGEDSEMDSQVGDLISFMENFDAEKYAEDTETRALMASLKERVDKLKQEPDWREKWEERIKEKRRKREEEYKKMKEEREEDDNRSVGGNDSQLGIGGASIGSKGESKSVQSERTQGKVWVTAEAIRALKEKAELKSQGRGEWEPSLSGKSPGVNFEERLAKHIADELLRNNPALARIHSNNSVRRILEQELQKQIGQQSGAL